jgi:hypothetical protein
MLPLSTEASATLVHNYKLVIRHPQLLLQTTVVTTGGSNTTSTEHRSSRATPPVPSPLARNNNTTSTEPRSSRRAHPGSAALSENARTRIATLSYDIRQYFPGIADSATRHRTSTNKNVYE